MGWQYYNPNPAGRKIGDCTTRALACALTGDDWLSAFAMQVAEAVLRYDETDADLVLAAVLRREGWGRSLVDDDTTVANFATAHPHGVYILCPAGHVVCVAGGDWYDTFDSGDLVPIYFWERVK